MPTDLVAVMDYTSIKELTMNSMNVMNENPISVMEFYNSYSNICKTLRLHQYCNIDLIT